MKEFLKDVSDSDWVKKKKEKEYFHETNQLKKKKIGNEHSDKHLKIKLKFLNTVKKTFFQAANDFLKLMRLRQ